MRPLEKVQLLPSRAFNRPVLMTEAHTVFGGWGGEVTALHCYFSSFG